MESEQGGVRRSPFGALSCIPLQFCGVGCRFAHSILCMEGRQLTKSANFSTNRLRRMRTYVRTGTYFLLPGLPRSLCHIVSALEVVCGQNRLESVCGVAGLRPKRWIGRRHCRLDSCPSLTFVVNLTDKTAQRLLERVVIRY